MSTTPLTSGVRVTYYTPEERACLADMAVLFLAAGARLKRGLYRMSGPRWVCRNLHLEAWRLGRASRDMSRWVRACYSTQNLVMRSLDNWASLEGWSRGGGYELTRGDARAFRVARIKWCKRLAAECQAAADKGYSTEAKA